MHVVQHYGLIGYPLSHSFSPGYFAEKFLRERIDARYDAFPLARIEDFPALLKTHPELRGLNVTIPHKQAVISYMDALHPEAEAVGAVNCIDFADGKLTGHNTDWRGFRDSLTPLLKSHQTRALVLGTGGASRAVGYALQTLCIGVTLVSRVATAASISYDGVTPQILAAHTLIVNTTPLGMYPAVDAAPTLPYAAVGPQHLLYDLVYNPRQTRFLALGAARGAATKNGQEMLELQAEASWKIWNGGL